MSVPGTDFWQRHIRFRDALRKDRALAEAYSKLKRELAVAHSTDIIAYTDAKSEFIRAVEDRVQAG
ncbi:MAG: GrpB family protein [Actinomycetota bacterium]